MTLTNFNGTGPRIAQVFTINYGSTGRHHTFLGLGGGTLYGNLGVNGDILERGTKLVDKYLGKGATAADSDKLDGQDSSYYLDYSNLKNKPSIPAAYALPIATTTVLGGVKSATTGTAANRDYNVQVKSDGTMKVNVPWTDTNTHYTARLYVGAQNTQASGATSNGGTYLKLFEDSTRRDQYKITGSGATTVTSDASGNISINTDISGKANQSDFNNLKTKVDSIVQYKYTYQNGYLVVQEL